MTLLDTIRRVYPAGPPRRPKPAPAMTLQETLNARLARRRQMSATMIAGRPRTWPTVEHRFPPLGPDAHPSAVKLGDHVIGTMMKHYDALDTTNADTTLSAEGRQQRVAAITGTARDQLARVDNPADLGGDLRVLTQARTDAATSAARKTAPDPAMVPLLTAPGPAQAAMAGPGELLGSKVNPSIAPLACLTRPDHRIFGAGAF